MSHFTNGFADELVKVAKLRIGAKFMKRLGKSKELRDAIKRSALLGGATGAASGALSRDDRSTLRKILGGATVGLAGGAITGATFPGWFARSNMRAADEVGKLGRAARKLR